MLLPLFTSTETAARETLEKVMADALSKCGSKRSSVRAVCLAVSGVNHPTDQQRILSWLRLLSIIICCYFLFNYQKTVNKLFFHFMFSFCLFNVLNFLFDDVLILFILGNFWIFLHVIDNSDFYNRANLFFILVSLFSHGEKKFSKNNVDKK